MYREIELKLVNGRTKYRFDLLAEVGDVSVYSGSGLSFYIARAMAHDYARRHGWKFKCDALDERRLQVKRVA